MSVRALLGAAAGCGALLAALGLPALYTEVAAQPAAKSTATAAGAPPAANAASAELWIEALATGAVQPAQTEAARLVAAVRIASMGRRALPGYADRAIRKIATAAGTPWALKTDLELLAGTDSESGASADGAALQAAGVVQAFALLGPLRDTGGGLLRHEGPEGPSDFKVDPKMDYSWGTVETRWRALPAGFSAAAGVPLDLFVHPRKESCTYLASAVTLAAAGPLTVRVAASGQVRVLWDANVIATEEDVMAKALVDRAAASVTASAGVHLLVVKVCSGALDDSGRVRIRLESNGQPAAFQASADLSKLQATSLLTGVKSDRPQPAPTRVGTALEAALGSAASSTQTLQQAFARTLGGADDLRSPRAQGLVDSLANAAAAGAGAAGAGRSLDAADLLDLAFATPPGAPRIALLHRTEKRAAEQADATTAARAARELVRTRIGMPDWALATARRANLFAATDADGKLLATEVQNSMGSDALRLEAYRALATDFKNAPQTLSRAQLDTLSQLAFPLDRQVAREVGLERARRGDRSISDLTTVAALGSDADLAIAARTFIERDVTQIGKGLIAANLVRSSGNREAAARLFEVLAGYCPNRADIWESLAQLRAGTPGAAAALDRARRLAPTSAALRAQAEFERGAGAAKPERDESYLRPSAEVIKRRVGIPKGPTDVSERELYWLRAVTMHPDQRVSQLIHYAREIVIAPRTTDELNEDLPQEGDLTELLRARVHRVNGGLAYPTEESNDGVRPRIRWPELRPGDVVEVAVRSYTRSAIGGRGDSPFYFMDYAGSPSTRPLLYNEVIADYPKSRPLHVDVLGVSTHTKTESDDGDRHIVRMVWDKPIQIADEPLAPPLSETVPMVVGSTYRNWDEFRTWYREAVKGFTEPDLEVQRIAKDLTKGKLTKAAKVKALFEFVADDIRYVNYVSGEWWLPNRPQQLLARREGDCDDKAILLISLLKAVGIEAEEVLVQTRMTNMPTVVGAKNVAIPLFDHGIAFLPGPNGGQYLDATSPQSRLGPLPGMDARASALRLWGPAEIVRLPESSSADHGSRARWVVDLAADGSGSINAEEQHRGDQAFFLRMNLKEQEARHAYVEQNLVSPWVSMVTVDDEIAFDGDTGEGCTRVKYKAKSGSFARRELSALVVALGGSQSMAARLAALPVRTLPVELPPQLAPSATERELTLRAPAGFVFERAPLGEEGGVADGGEFGRATLTVKRKADGREAVVTRKIAFEANRISVEKYPQFRAWLLAVDALMNRELRLLPVSANPEAGGGRR